VGQSRDTCPTSPPTIIVTQQVRAEAWGDTHSCSTSDHECNRGPCGQSHHTSSKFAGDHRILRDRNRLHSCRPGSNCVRYGRLGRICSILGRRWEHHCSYRPNQPGNTREKCVQQHRSGSTTSPWELLYTRGLKEGNVIGQPIIHQSRWHIKMNLLTWPWPIVARCH
jgi:hypothetical protein